MALEDKEYFAPLVSITRDSTREPGAHSSAGSRLVQNPESPYTHGMEFRLIIVLMCCLGCWITATGCQTAHSNYDSSIDFSVYESYAWDPHLKSSESIMDRDFPGLVRIVEESMSAGLRDRHLSTGQPETADLIVSYHFEIAPYRDEDGDPLVAREVPSSRLGPVEVVPFGETQIDDESLRREMSEGTLLINLTDRQTGKLVWQGWASRIFDLNRMREEEWSRNPEEMYRKYRKRNIQKAVAKIFNSYPPESLADSR